MWQEWVLIYLDLTPAGLLELCERPINRISKGGAGLPLFLSVSELSHEAAVDDSRLLG
jgi:hypothetical protein